ncbi:MAG: 16S rRNA (guanine(966)-N(2))-methyltransferase RsmD [Coraliomargaritaceae bacterium]
MRITGGKARGIALKSPKDHGTRPATDRTREALFSSLAVSILDTSCLDLFAGTGSYGFEALSRGAKSCQFIEHNRVAIDCLKQNAQAVTKSAELCSEAVQVKQSDLLKSDPNAHTSPQSFDFIFLDPPYTLWESHAKYLLNTLALSYAHEDTQLILECPGDLSLDEVSSDWSLKKRLGKSGKGKPTIAIYQKIKSAS